LLSALDLHHPPCQDLQANRMFYALATLACNALMALKLIPLPESEQPKRVRTLIRLSFLGQVHADDFFIVPHIHPAMGEGGM
jgi:hypothetical protein